MQKAVRKLGKKSEYSYLINIPKEFVEKYGWMEKQKLVVTDKGRGVLEIRDWRRR